MRKSFSHKKGFPHSSSPSASFPMFYPDNLCVATNHIQPTCRCESSAVIARLPPAKRAAFDDLKGARPGIVDCGNNRG